MNNLATVHGDLGRHREALGLREQMLARRRARSGRTTPTRSRA